MKLDTFASASLLLSAASASVVVPRGPTPEQAAAVALAAWKRASPDAPNGYTPTRENCPSVRPTLRNGRSLSPNETAWLETRRNNTVSAMRDLLGRLNITGFDSNSYIDDARNNVSALPNIGIAASGGGWRALLNGAGAVAAFDSRTPNSTNTGHIGGLLQSSTYLAGLSGGGWLVSSLYGNNWTSIQDIIDTNSDQSGSFFNFDNGILEGPDQGGIQVLSTAQYYSTIYDQVNGKSDAGFDTSITDYWGRALSFNLLNASNGGPAYTFSSIADDEYFTRGEAPMPLLVADGRNPGEIIIASNTTNYEFNPWEMGSFDPTVFGFVPLRYVGSNFSAGELPSNESCVRGFDSLSFVFGTSSSLFNQALLQLNDTNIPDTFRGVLQGILSGVGEDNDDIADWSPNPFYHWNNDTNPSAQTKRLTLVDGGEDFQNIPFNPLIQPLRNVDVIFAVDSSADTVSDVAPGWPNGTAWSPRQRHHLPVRPRPEHLHQPRPEQPPQLLRLRREQLLQHDPLIVYLANAPYVYESNTSTYKQTYNTSERNAMIENGYNVVTMGNAGTGRGTTVPDVCRECFDRYCWNGTIDSRETTYNPSLKLEEVEHQERGRACYAYGLLVGGSYRGELWRLRLPEVAPVLSTPDTHIFEDPTLPVDPSSLARTTDAQLAITYEIERTVQEIRAGRWKRIALQFPDHMLVDAPRVYAALSKGLDKARKAARRAPPTPVDVNGAAEELAKADINANGEAEDAEEQLVYPGRQRSYGACCSCLSPTARLPVIYVFTTRPLDLDPVVEVFKQTYPEKDQRIVLMADIPYSNHLPPLLDRLQNEGYTALFLTSIVHDPSSPLPNRACRMRLRRIRRLLETTSFSMSPTRRPLYFSPSPPASVAVHIYQTDTPKPTEALLVSSAQTLRRRYALLTRLSVEPVGSRQRNDCGGGKKSYTFVVGKINAAKVANFSEVGGWVVIGCWESSLIESKDFWKPIITPFELQLTLQDDSERIWTGEWTGDFQAVLKGKDAGASSSEAVAATAEETNGSAEAEDGATAGGGNGETEEWDSEEESAPPEFDLRTGRYVSHARPMRATAAAGTSSNGERKAGRRSTGRARRQEELAGTSLIKRANGDVAQIGGVVSPGAEFLRSKRTWQGLGSDFDTQADGESAEGSQTGARIEEGRGGLARGYVVGDDAEITARATAHQRRHPIQHTTRIPAANTAEKETPRLSPASPTCPKTFRSPAAPSATRGPPRTTSTPRACPASSPAADMETLTFPSASASNLFHAPSHDRGPNALAVMHPATSPQPAPHKSRFESILTTHPTIAESLLASLPTRSLIDLFHTSRYLRTFLAEYPLAWRTLSFRAPTPALGVNNPEGDAVDGPGARNAKQYALDALLIQVVVPFGTRLTSLDLCNTAVSGVRLVSRVLEPRVQTLQHLSVRGCKNVSIKYHLVPFLEPYVHPGSPWAKTTELALRSLYTYRCRHHRRRPYLPSSLMRRDSDSEPTHQLIEICHQLGIWTDTMWCTTPGGRCFRRKDYYSGRAAPGTNEVWVPFDRLWRSMNRIGPQDSDNPPAHSDGRLWEDAETRSHRIFVEDIKCDQCGDAILERCEQCSIRMHCMGCRKTLCASCAFNRPIPRKKRKTNRAFTNQAFGTMNNLGVIASSSAGGQSHIHQEHAAEEERKISNRFWWAPGATRSPNLMSEIASDDDASDSDEPGPLHGGNPLAVMNVSTPPKLNMHWCCVEPVFSGGGGIVVLGPGVGGRGGDKIRATPLPKGQQYEDPDFMSFLRSPELTRELKNATLYEHVMGDQVDIVPYLQQDSLELQASKCPRSLCQDCYRTFRWKIACKACKKPLCKEHDFRGLKIRKCGYRDLHIEREYLRTHTPASMPPTFPDLHIPAYVPPNQRAEQSSAMEAQDSTDSQLSSSPDLRNSGKSWLFTSNPIQEENDMSSSIPGLRHLADVPPSLPLSSRPRALSASENRSPRSSSPWARQKSPNDAQQYALGKRIAEMERARMRLPLPGTPRHPVQWRGCGAYFCQQLPTGWRLPAALQRWYEGVR
ncbi:diphthamide biosynthesis protein [Botryosphaeria dothidea]|uniref:Lysophospholipase n=1 Tax=Botryosphaeria dothidea TaxID=55169 RepID=A0A8H4ITK9_9PEZI|nr:diphthamide biosynthesis protein [Botryosphaeria dothidea]